jgi:leader peptidase (prepilin peptidase)/N-methyltransferase
MLAAFRDPHILPWICLLFGLMVGSFLNVVIYRLPLMLKRDWREQALEVLTEWAGEKDAPAALLPLTGALEKLAGEQAKAQPYTIVRPRSGCPHCGHRITALENIPVISYLMLRGKCAKCKARISARYPVVEAFTGLLSAYISWHFGFSLATVGALIFGWALIAGAVIDFDTQLLPDGITLPLVWLGLLLNLWGTYTTLESALIGAVAGYLSLWSVYWLFKFATGKEGLGYGDFKLLAAIGAFLGWQMLPSVILLSSLVGALLGIALIVFTGRGRHQPMPFGPYLAGAGLLALFLGEHINRMYLQYF